MDRWFSTFSGFRCFESMKKSSCLDTEFPCFLEIICEVPFQMMKLSNFRLLKTFHQDFWIWLLNLSPRRKSLTRTVFWWEQVISNLASQEKLGVILRQAKQSQPSLMALNVFGTQLLLVGVMILSIFDSWYSYHQNLKTNCSSFQFLFLKIAVSQNSSLK